jgi:hypothetical protein
VGRKRKPPSEWTNDEAMGKLFPKRVVKRLKKEAEKARPKEPENRIPKEKS